MEDKIRGQQHQHPMHVTEESASSGVAAASALASSSKGNFKIRLPTVDIQDCSDQRGLSEDDLEDEFG